MEENIVFNTEDVENNKIMGILAYLGILVLIPIFAAKDSQYARFHANQGLVLLISAIILFISSSIITAIIGLVTFGLLALPISIILNLSVLAFWITYIVFGIMNACSGEPKKLPLIGSIIIIK